MEVDHRTGEHSLRKISDIQQFVEGIVFVRKEDLAFLCKPCHKIKTLAERQGMSHEDAAIEKQAITICKEKADVVKAWIIKKGEVPARTVKERREQITRILKEGK
jgi:glutaredoxin